MKLRKRVLCAITATAMLCTMLMGCSGSTSPSSEKPANSTEAPISSQAQESTSTSGDIEIQFWDMPWGGADYIDMAKKTVDEYNAQTEGVTVKYQSIPWSNWYQTFSTAIASGTAPDISTGAGYQAFQFSQIDAILPIDDVIADMEADGSLADFPDNSIEPLKYDGKQVAFPWNQDIRVLWYNKNILDAAGLEVPKNWEEFRAVAKAVTKDDVYGFVTAGGDPNGVHFLLNMLINNGGGLFDKDQNVAVTSNERNLETLKFIRDMAADGSINPASAGYSSDDAERAFVSGKAAMFIRTPGLLKNYPEMEGTAFICEPLKGLHGDTGTLTWYNNIMIYSSTKHSKETKDFLKWWVTNQQDLFLKGGLTSLPVRISTSRDALYTSDENLKRSIDLWAPVGKTSGAQSPYLFAQLNEIEGDDILINAVQGLIMQQDPATILQSIQDGVEGIMAKE